MSADSMEILFKVTDPNYKGTAAEKWNERCAASIRQEKLSAEKKYSIRFGQTEIYCLKCGKSAIPGHHTCLDLRFEKLREARLRKIAESKTEKTSDLCEKLRAIGRTKAAVKLMIPRKIVNKWIDRGNIPLRYREAVSAL